MFKLNWKTWLAVLIALGLTTAGLSALLHAQEAATASRWVGFVGVLLCAAWTLLGLFRWRDVPWVKRVNSFVIALLGFGTLIMLFRAVGWQTGAQTTLYLGLAVIGFLAGINLLRLLLRPGHPILGVARTMIEEALRMGIALIFIVGLLVILVLMPLVLGSEDRVTYMVQRFLTYSTAVMSVLLGLMTVLLAARTVSLELSSRQAHMTLTKPIARWQYLLGKWLGIVMLNAVLVAVGGVAIYGFTMAIAQNPALNDLDRYEVDREVLTARLSIRPEPIGITWAQMYQNVLADKQSRDPAKFGEVGEPFAALPDEVQQEIIAETVSGFYTIDGGSSRQFRFEGLGQAVAAAEASQAQARAMLRDQAGLSAKEAEQVVQAALGRPNELTRETMEKLTPAQVDEVRRLVERDVIQLVFTPDAKPSPTDLFAEVTMRVNGYPWPPPQRAGAPPPRRELVLETPNEIAIPAGLIDSDGTLVVRIDAPRQRRDGSEQRYLQLNHKDSEMALYYRVGSFEVNLARAMVIVWLKLCFFAMFGLCVGALLSFPVAALAGLILFAAATFSGAIHDALDTFITFSDSASAWDSISATLGRITGYLSEGKLYDALRVLLRLAAEAFMMLVPAFNRFPVAEPLSNGQVIPNATVFNAFWKIGLMWTGAVGLIGLLLFTKREIAGVTV